MEQQPQQQEEILSEEAEGDRLCVFPIKYADLWAMYKKAVASFWTVEEVGGRDSSSRCFSWGMECMHVC